MPTISVIVPVHNSAGVLEACLQSIRRSACRDFELIVVDDASIDDSRAIAIRYADKVIDIPDRAGRKLARQRGTEASHGSILVNIDSDVLIRPDALSVISDFFLENPRVSAVTGTLSKEHPNRGFFSQYKNLYMYFIFSKLPRKTGFLYWSIYAMRRDCLQSIQCDVEIADDTALGQGLAAAGKEIAFLSNLEVVHLKKYDLFSFFKNDFLIPFDWAKIFIMYAGWRQLGKLGTGYAHSPKEQLLSVILAPLATAMVIISALCCHIPASFIFLTILTWLALNLKFLRFLTREKGIAFGLISIFVTFFDNVVMAAGIVSGFAAFAINKEWRNNRRGCE